jgi:putative exporter of polyketide antibiotics
MTKRRQVLRFREALASFFFFSLILGLCFLPPSLLAQAEPVALGVSAAIGKACLTALSALAFLLVSAATLNLCGYHRRDYASPRRIGRRT